MAPAYLKAMNMNEGLPKPILCSKSKEIKKLPANFERILINEIRLTREMIIKIHTRKRGIKYNKDLEKKLVMLKSLLEDIELKKKGSIKSAKRYLNSH